jgi:hypothetical protein
MTRAQMPPVVMTDEGVERRVGVEIELSGVTGEQLAEAVEAEFGGVINRHSRVEYQVNETSCGDFKLELDAALLKLLVRESEPDKTSAIDNLLELSEKLLSQAAEQLVPWEIVAPPLPVSRLGSLDPLVERLRLAGARGTKHALRFAFGVHLNPELPSLNSDTILSYLRAYCCLYDWLVEVEEVDISRRTTPFINHYDDEYIRKIIDPAYKPTLSVLIDDYLSANPTRNRGLDMLPMFNHLDQPRVEKILADELIQSRPTLHYRLPNCDIDNPDWGLHRTWNNWLVVERLAGNSVQLGELCAAYCSVIDNRLPLVGDNWLETTRDWVNNGTLIHADK